MINYAVYNATTGAIEYYGRGIVPDGVTYLEHAVEGALDDYCVDVITRTLKPKTDMSLAWPSTPVVSDGVTEAVIDGLPVGTVCSFTVVGQPYNLTITDGSLEIALDDPEVVTVRFWHPLYKHPPVEVTFI